nr:hypothetical protein [Bacteroidota bacterium]
MRYPVKVFGVLLIVSALLMSCAKKASDYDALVKEYKKVACIGMVDKNASMSEKANALERQLELNEEYKKALKTLSSKEQAKLLMAWSKAMAEVADGKCD